MEADGASWGRPAQGVDRPALGAAHVEAQALVSLGAGWDGRVERHLQRGEGHAVRGLRRGRGSAYPESSEKSNINWGRPGMEQPIMRMSDEKAARER